MRTPLSTLIIVAFLINTFGPLPAQAQGGVFLPAPGIRVSLSPEFNPPVLKGIKVHPDNPFRFDFILDKGDSTLANDQLKEESSKLIKYFLASLTVPEKDLWVNLSPYEKDRIVPTSFGQTEMGRDLLAQDYLLKQITASLIYPEDEFGKTFWKRIYEEAAKKFGTTNIPVNTFNKVWIIPEKAVVYENAQAGTAYVVESRLKVMLEQDYLALEKNTEGGHVGQAAATAADPNVSPQKDVNALGSQIVREIVIPQLTKEVNENKNFAQLRQVYNSLILATWYKKKIKDSILNQVYADRNKVAGVNIDDPQEKQKIYQQYLQAFKKGVYNYIKEDTDPITQQIIPRKYFSGGMLIAPRIDYAQVSQLPMGLDNAQIVTANLEVKKFDQSGSFKLSDRAMTAKEIVDSIFQEKKLGDAVRNKFIEAVGRNMYDTRIAYAALLNLKSAITIDNFEEIIKVVDKHRYSVDANILYATLLNLKSIITTENFEQVINGLFAVSMASRGSGGGVLNRLVHLQESFSPDELKLHWAEIIDITKSSEDGHLFLEALGNLKKEFPDETSLYWPRIFRTTRDVRYLEYIFKFMIGFKEKINNNFKEILDDIDFIVKRLSNSLVLRDLSDFIEIVTPDNLRKVGIDFVEIRKELSSFEDYRPRTDVMTTLREFKQILIADNLLLVGRHLIEIAKDCSEDGYEEDVLKTLAELKHMVTLDNLLQIGKALVEIKKKNNIRNSYSERGQVYLALSDFKEIITPQNLNQIGEIFINSDYRDVRQILLALKNIIKPENLEQIIKDLPYGIRSDGKYRNLLSELKGIVTPENLKQIVLALIEIKKKEGYGIADIPNVLISLKDMITPENLLKVGMDLIEIKDEARKHTYDWVLLENLAKLKDIITPENCKQIGFDLIDIAKAGNSEKGTYEVKALVELAPQINPENFRRVGMALVDLTHAVGSDPNDQYHALGAMTGFLGKLSLTEMNQSLENTTFLAKFSKKQIRSIFYALSSIYDLVKAESGDINLHVDFYAELAKSNDPQRFSKLLDAIYQALKAKEISINLNQNDKDVIERIQSLIGAGFPVLPELLHSDKNIGELSALAESISNGHFDINDDLHVALNYSNLLNDLNYGVQGARTISYEDFKEKINEIRQGIGITEEGQVKKEHEIEVRGLAYEAHLTRERILELQAKAESLGRKLIVVENLSYGAVALAPVTVQKKGKKFIVGTDIEVWSTKIGSTESHNNEFVMREDLFTGEQLRTLVSEQPLVVVVDGSTSINDPTRTSAHIPDGHKGYVNEFIAINQALAGRVNPNNFYRDEDFIKELQKQGVFSNTITRIKEVIPRDNTVSFKDYVFGVWYPGSEDYLYARVGKQKDRILPRIDVQNIQGPAVIFFQSGIRPNDVPESIKKDFIGGSHSPVFFDDKKHYTEFELAFRPNYGFVRSHAYVDFSRKVYNELRIFLHEDQITEEHTLAIGEQKEVDALFLDLDGTLAPTDKKIPEDMLNILLGLARKDKKIIIVTEDIERNLPERLENYIPLDLRIHFTMVAGGKSYTWNASGQKIYLNAFNQEGIIKPDFRREIDGVIQGLDYQKYFFPDERSERINPEYRIDLRVKENQDRKEMAQALNREFNRIGIQAKAYAVGKTSIKIVRQHKEHAVKALLQELGILSSKTLIMGDSAREHEIDHEFLSELPDALNVNVGKPSKSIARDHPFVKQFKEAVGINGAKRVLMSLLQRGKVPLAIFPDFRSIPALAGVGSSDYAMASKGGIDFNSEKMNLETRNESGEIKFQIDPAMLEQLQNAPGFTPVIINIQPMTDLPGFLGLHNNPQSQESLAMH